MSDIALIVLARAVHVMAGVTWAGATFVLAVVVVPLATRHGSQGAGRWLGMVARRSGSVSGIAALLTVVSGIYLLMTLHPNDGSPSGLVLKSGALAALLSLAVALLVGRPAGVRLQKLNASLAEGELPSPEIAQQVARLGLRARMSSRLAAGLLGVAVLAMAVFRYASILS